eukprot:Skav217357  [mRNA]  locus=scaffold4442:86870:95394:+ [translate_table: standard]
MTCQRLCLALLAVAQGLRNGQLDWRLEVVRNLVSSGERLRAAKSGELAQLVAANSSEGVDLLQGLARDRDVAVRYGVATSSALKALAEAMPEEGAQVIMHLLEYDPRVRSATSQLPAWPAFKRYATPLVRSFNASLEHGSLQERVSVAKSSTWRAVLNLNLDEGKELFAKLINDTDPLVRQSAIDAPAWSTFFRYDVAEALSQFKALSRSLVRDTEVAKAKGFRWRKEAEAVLELLRQSSPTVFSAAKRKEMRRLFLVDDFRKMLVNEPVLGEEQPSCSAGSLPQSPEKLWPLHVAAKSHSLPAVRLLLKMKADPTQRSSHGRTALAMLMDKPQDAKSSELAVVFV